MQASKNAVSDRSGDVGNLRRTEFSDWRNTKVKVPKHKLPQSINGVAKQISESKELMGLIIVNNPAIIRAQNQIKALLVDAITDAISRPESPTIVATNLQSICPAVDAEQSYTSDTLIMRVKRVFFPYQSIESNIDYIRKHADKHGMEFNEMPLANCRFTLTDKKTRIRVVLLPDTSDWSSME